MKKILFSIVFIINLSFAGFYETSNETSFKNGFYAGLQALEFQAKNDGFRSKRIFLTKEYLLISEIENKSIKDVLFLQLMSNREGFETHLTKEFITFGEFERLADAKDTAKIIENNFNIKTKIIKNQKEIFTYPFLYQDFYNNLLSQAMRDGIMIKTEFFEKPKIVTKKISTKSNNVTKPKTKNITFKNQKVMSYIVNGNETNSANFEDRKFITNTDNLMYRLDKKITTEQGETFYKVYNQNIYFSDRDVIIK